MALGKREREDGVVEEGFPSDQAIVFAAGIAAGSAIQSMEAYVRITDLSPPPDLVTFAFG